MNRLLGKKTIVVGGTSGIGKAIVEKFSHEGSMVVFCGRSKEKGHAIQNACQNSKYIYCDVTDKENIKDFFISAIDFLNGLDIAINNSGISGEICAFHETDDILRDKVLST